MKNLGSLGGEKEDYINLAKQNVLNCMYDLINNGDSNISSPTRSALPLTYCLEHGGVLTATRDYQWLKNPIGGYT